MGLLRRKGNDKPASKDPGMLAVQGSPKSESAARAAARAQPHMETARSLSCPHEVRPVAASGLGQCQGWHWSAAGCVCEGASDGRVSPSCRSFRGSGSGGEV